MATEHVTPRRTQAQPYPKPALYEAIANVNRDLGLLIADFDRLREFRFKRQDIDAFIAKTEHLRSRVNGELLEHQLARELKDEHHFWLLDKKFEDRYEDPNDVLIGAKLRLEQMASEERHAVQEADRIRERRKRGEQELQEIIGASAASEPTPSDTSLDLDS